MKRFINLVVCALVVQLGAMGVVLAQDGDANPAWGGALAERNRCFECHGADGYAVDPEAPHLAGQSESYIVRQLNHYRAGRREHPFMETFAGNLSNTDMADVAAYFACQGERERDTERCTRQR